MTVHTTVPQWFFAAALVTAASPAFAQTPAGSAAPAMPVPAPVARLSATSLGFGNVIYGSTPASQAITLSNIGTAPMQIQGLGVTGNSDFTTTNNCGTSLAAGAHCAVTVSFAPHALGARSAVMAIRTNAPGQPHKVQLAGTGCRYFSPAAARFFLTSC